MHETDAEVVRLQNVLDRSFAVSGDHLRSIFDEGNRLTARELVDEITGVVEIHLATVTRDGTPLVAPVDAIMFRGSIWFGLPGTSVRARLVRRDHRVSASYVRGTQALIVHGVAREIDESDELWAGYESAMADLYIAMYGPDWINWYEQQKGNQAPKGFTGYIEPRAMFAKR